MSPSPNRLPKSPQSAPSTASPDELPAVPSEPNQEAPLTNPSDTASETSEAAALVPKRPLMRPVSRPQPSTPVVNPPKPASESVATPSPETATATPADGLDETEDAKSLSRMQPIPPPSEPKQYRAIGLVRGRYTPSEEQFTRGQMVTADGAEIEAVLLGRVMSLVRNHLDLEQEHLWVVYPRTRETEESLHVQIVGVWEPEKLSQPASDTDLEAISEADSAIEENPHSPGYEDDYFSVRGEVVFCSEDDKQVVIKIQQAGRKTSDKPKAFKLKLDGSLGSPKNLGYFWSLDVKRMGTSLVITSGTAIGLVPPKKKPTGFSKDRRSFRKGPPRSGGRGSAGTPISSTPTRREPIPKPVKRSEQSSEG